MKKIAIVLLGPPGAGKGTQAELLAKNFSIYHLETSKIIEERLKRDEPGIEIERKKWLSGELNTPSKVSQWVIDKIKELSGQSKGIIFSGSPRTLEEAEKVYPVILQEYGKDNIYVINIKVSPKIALFRNVHRKICKNCRHPIVYSEKTKNLKNCPMCGGELMTRALDKPDVIRHRLEVYKKETKPVLDYFKERGILQEIDGEGTPQKVNAEILKALPFH